MKSCQPGALSHLIHIASADTTENEIYTQNSNHRHTHQWIFGCTPRRFSPRHLRARIPPRECQTDSRNNRWPVNACPREAAHKKVDTFVMVVFVVVGATVLVVVVIAIEEWMEVHTRLEPARETVLRALRLCMQFLQASMTFTRSCDL